MARTQTTPLHYEVNGTGPMLVLAHGGGGGIQMNYGPILDRLTSRFTVLGADLPGSGDTPRSPDPLTLDGLADSLVAAADAAGLDTFGLLGYSMGCSVAIRLTTRHPDRVDSLALVAGFARPDRYLRLALDVWQTLLDGDPTVLAEYLLAMGAGEQLVYSLPEDGFDQLVSDSAAAVPPGSADHVALAKTIDVRADLARIGVPTLVVKSALDRLATPRHSDELAAGIPKARLVELDSGHSVAAERPEQLLAHLVAHFTRRADKPSSAS